MSKIDIFFVIAATVVIWRLLSRRTVAVGSCPHGQFLPQPKNQLFGTQITFWRRTTGLNRCCNNNRNDWRNADGGRDDRENAEIAFVAPPFPAARRRSRCRIEEELLYGAYLAMQDGARAGARHLLRLFAVVALR